MSSTVSGLGWMHEPLDSTSFTVRGLWLRQSENFLISNRVEGPQMGEHNLSTVLSMQHSGFSVGVGVVITVLLFAACGTRQPSLDVSSLQPVECPGEVVPTELKVSCHQYLMGNGYLVVAVLHAEEPVDDPVLVVHGGPGGRAVADRHYWLTPRSQILARSDMILVDQRGSGWSKPSLDCAEVDDPTISLSDAYRACRNRLANKGIDFAQYQVPDIAADLVALRNDLEVASWNLYAVSFGTRVALTLLQTDTEAITSAVLDSPMPLQVAAYDDLLEGATAAIDRSLKQCADLNACAPRQAERLDALLVDLRDTPAPVTTQSRFTRTIDDVALAGLLVEALAHPDGPTMVPKAIQAAVDGKFSEAVAQLDRLGWGGRSVGDSLSEGAQLSSECADELPFNDGDDPVAQRPLTQAIAGIEAEVRLLCSIWDVPASTLSSPAAEAQEVDVLILSGLLDPVTPTPWAYLAADNLDGAVVVESATWSHVPSLADQCAADLVARFFSGYRPKSSLNPC